MKRYKQYKPTGISWLPEIPAHWDTMRIRGLFEESIEKTVDDSGTLLSLSQYTGVSLKSEAGKTGMFEAESTTGYKIVHPGQFVMNIMLAWNGSYAVSDLEGIISPAYFVFDLSDNCDPDYMNFLLRDGSMVQQYETSSRGVGTIQRNLYVLWFMESIVPIPPITTQKRIGAFLVDKCMKIDAVAADIQSQIDVLEQYKRSVITETVTKGLNPNAEMKDSGIQWIGEMPMHWDCIRGKYILQYLQKLVKEDDGVITCFRDGEVTLRSNRREDGFTMSDKEIGYQGIDIGDLVVHGMDGFAGAIGISDSRGKASPVLNVLGTDQNKRYIMYYLRSMAYSDVFLALATGIRVRSCDLRWNKLAELMYPVPPIEEQEKIVEHIDSVIKKTDEVIADKKEQLETIEEYKKSLIYEYVTGNGSLKIMNPV